MPAELMLASIWVLLLSLVLSTLLVPLSLIGLVLRICIAALRPIVAGLALGIARIVLTEGLALLSMLKATVLRRAERVLPTRWAKTLVLRRVTTVVLWRLLVITLRRIALLWRIALLGRISSAITALLRRLAVATLSAVVIVGARHTGY